jgi:hypothetical protein
MKEAEFPMFQYNNFLHAAGIPPPIQCFSLPNMQVGSPSSKEQRPMQGLRSTLMQVVEEYERDAVSQTEIIRRLESQITTIQVQNDQQLQEIKESIEATDKKRKQQYEKLNERLASSTTLNSVRAEELSQVKQQLKDIQSKLKERLERLSDLLNNSEVVFKTQVERMEQGRSSLEKK